MSSLAQLEDHAATSKGFYEKSTVTDSLPGRERFKIIPISSLPTDELKIFAIRLNSLGSLFYFSKTVLRRRRLTERLHKPICDALETTDLKLLVEFPRDHFKTSICSEAFPLWRALPFNALEEDAFKKLGYSDAFIAYMRRVHNIDQRTLIVSEVITNAKKIGKRINFHYYYNDLFREVFKDIIPDSSCKWTEESMTHKRSANSPNGEGTFDFIGVGGALQSRHYDLIIEDDLVGKKAADSPIVLDDTINYHQILSGAWDTDIYNIDSIGAELVVGNRWAMDDLNSWIRYNEPLFNIISHDALGGCCDLHPEGIPIFPEEFSLARLKELENKLGPYIFSCQLRNRPINPETRVFKDEWLRYFSYRAAGDGDNRVKIIHSVEEGEIIDDLFPSSLQRTMVIDPNHSGESGRCKHAITIVGLDHRSGHKYLLDVWAESCNYEKFIDQIYVLGERWKLDKFWLETVAAQKYLKFHLESIRNKRFMRIEELKTSRSFNGKKDRIEALVPFFFRREFWVRREQREFLTEYQSYPSCRTLDVLDTLGYQPQTWDAQGVDNHAVQTIAARQRAKLTNLRRFSA